MSENPVILIACLLFLGFGFFSKLTERWAFTAPMVFCLVGLSFGLFYSSEMSKGITAPWVKILAEITLISVLFNDASTIDLKALKKEKGLPLRLLFIGLPITMGLGVVFAKLIFPGEPFIQLTLMALILSPTDAALGLAVVNTKSIPLKIRQSINVESGLNDGIALPPILICLALLNPEPINEQGWTYWALFTLKQFAFGPLIGLSIGWLGGRLAEYFTLKEWMSPVFLRIVSIALSILAYYVAENIHGNGFIASFFAGLFLGTKNPHIKEKIQEFGEAGSQILVLFIFLLLGLVLIPHSLPYWDWLSLGYALLSLTLIRILPVLISLLGTKLNWSDRLFIAWFGPRGIASILYVLLVVVELGLTGNEKILSVVCLTVLISVFVHGITALPLSNNYIKTQSHGNQ